MRVLVPFAKLHPITDRAVAEFFPDAQRVNVAGDNFAYWRLLRSVWDCGEDIVIIEHDIEPTRAAADQALSCVCDWGRSPYPWSITTTASFGFARFSAKFLQATSGLLGDEPIHWGLLAWTIEPKLESLGFKPHEHAPVGHHHWQTALPVERCNCGRGLGNSARANVTMRMTPRVRVRRWAQVGTSLINQLAVTASSTRS